MKQRPRVDRKLALAAAPPAAPARGLQGRAKRCMRCACASELRPGPPRRPRGAAAAPRADALLGGREPWLSASPPTLVLFIGCAVLLRMASTPTAMERLTVPRPPSEPAIAAAAAPCVLPLCCCLPATVAVG